MVFVSQVINKAVNFTALHADKALSVQMDIYTLYMYIYKYLQRAMRDATVGVMHPAQSHNLDSGPSALLVVSIR